MMKREKKSITQKYLRKIIIKGVRVEIKIKNKLEERQTKFFNWRVKLN